MLIKVSLFLEFSFVMYRKFTKILHPLTLNRLIARGGSSPRLKGGNLGRGRQKTMKSERAKIFGALFKKILVFLQNNALHIFL